MRPSKRPRCNIVSHQATPLQRVSLFYQSQSPCTMVVSGASGVGKTFVCHEALNGTNVELIDIHDWLGEPLREIEDRLYAVGSSASGGRGMFRRRRSKPILFLDDMDPKGTWVSVFQKWNQTYRVWVLVTCTCVPKESRMFCTIPKIPIDQLVDVSSAWKGVMTDKQLRKVASFADGSIGYMKHLLEMWNRSPGHSGLAIRRDTFETEGAAYTRRIAEHRKDALGWTVDAWDLSMRLANSNSSKMLTDLSLLDVRPNNKPWACATILRASPRISSFELVKHPRTLSKRLVDVDTKAVCSICNKPHDGTQVHPFTE